MADNTTNRIDALTSRYTEGFERFSQSQSGNVVLDFILFKRNLVPCTLQIVFILGVVGAWIIAVMGIIGQGPIGDFCHTMVVKDGKNVASFNFLQALGISVAVFVFSPFVLHYVLELIKVLVKLLWKFVLHVFEKVLVPLWNTLVVCFFANVAPQVLPFLYQRFMKVIDIFVNKLDPMLDAMIDMGVSFAMTVITLVKGCLWLPQRICLRIGRWLDRSDANRGE